MAGLENVRHEKFVQCIANGYSQRKAYRAAYPNSEKWKDETVDSKASALAKDGKVLARLRELAEKASTKAVMNATERKAWLTKVIQNPFEETKDKLKAVDLLNKMEGSYSETLEINGRISNPFEGLTTEQLEKLAGDCE